MDQGSTRKRSAVHNFAPRVTNFCVMWEGHVLQHDTKFGNCRCEIVGMRVIFIWSLIHKQSLVAFCCALSWLGTRWFYSCSSVSLDRGHITHSSTQERRNSCGLAMELLLSCINPSLCFPKCPWNNPIAYGEMDTINATGYDVVFTISTHKKQAHIPNNVIQSYMRSLDNI